MSCGPGLVPVSNLSDMFDIINRLGYWSNLVKIFQLSAKDIENYLNLQTSKLRIFTLPHKPLWDIHHIHLLIPITVSTEGVARARRQIYFLSNQTQGRHFALISGNWQEQQVGSIFSSGQEDVILT